MGFLVFRRQDAIATGADWYFTAQPCRRGHLTLRYTRNSTCRDCSRQRVAQNVERIRELARAGYAADPEKYRAKNRRQHEADRPTRNARSRAHYAANAEHMRDTNRAWRRAHPEKNRIYVQGRRARLTAGRNDLTAQDVAEITAMQRGRCAECAAKVPLTIDHIIPLARQGENTRRNVQMLCMPCNGAKNALDPIDFAQRRGRLL